MFAIVGDVDELQAKIEAENAKDEAQTTTTTNNGQAGTSNIGQFLSKCNYFLITIFSFVKV